MFLCLALKRGPSHAKTRLEDEELSDNAGGLPRVVWQTLWGFLEKIRAKVLGRGRFSEKVFDRKRIVVIDTNVLMGGLIAPKKASGVVLDLWERGIIRAAMTPELLREYEKVFARMRFGSNSSVRRREERFRTLLGGPHVLHVKTRRRLKVITECPSDNRLLECALAAGAGYIISQDKHLLRLENFHGVKIVSAHSFLRLEFPRQPSGPRSV